MQPLRELDTSPPPIAWQEPDDQRLFWRQDRVHQPRPVTPLTGDLGGRILEDGFNAAAAAFGLPLRVRFRRLATYSYQAVVPTTFDLAEMVRLHGQAEERLRVAGDDLGRLWQVSYLPEIQRHLEALDDRLAAGDDDDALPALLDDAARRATRLWEIHFLVGIPFLYVPSLFEETYRDLFPDRPGLEAYRLIEGAANENFTSEHELWALSRRALERPAVAAALAGDAPLADLAGSAEGREFRHALDGYLERYGQRSSEFLELANPSWIEDPTPVLHSLRNSLSQPERDPAQAAAAEAERRELLAAARERLAGHPAPVSAEFERLLAAARVASFLHSEHAFWIDQRGMYRVRRVLLAAGRRLAARGAIATSEDVFYLTWNELRQAVEEGAGALGERVAERRAEMERAAAAPPPPVLGTPPPGPPPDTALHRAIGKFVGGPPQPADGAMLRGNPGSPGRARGPARVVASLAEAHRVRPGDVLVAHTTAPPWTPLFATIAALVTDAGGVLSHGAIVAREYRVPAVLGTGAATRRISDGALVEVDGDAGTVRIIG